VTRPARIALLASAVALSCLAACSSARLPIERPTPKLAGASVRQGGFGSLLIRAALDVGNPNRFEIELRAIDWEIAIGDAAPIRGRSAYQLAIAGRRSERVTLLVRVPPAAAAPLSVRLASGRGELRVGGVMHFWSRRGDVALTFDVAAPR
jgi:hypothetical protein